MDKLDPSFADFLPVPVTTDLLWILGNKDNYMVLILDGNSEHVARS